MSSSKDSKLPLKLGQTPVGSPRTLESRKKLASLFGSYLAPQAHAGPSRSSDSDPGYGLQDVPSEQNAEDVSAGAVEAPTDAGGPRRGPGNGIWSWLSNGTRIPSEASGSALSPEDEGYQSISDGVAKLDTNQSLEEDVASLAYIYDLPDDVLLQISKYLPSTPSQLCALSLVSRRFAYLSSSPALWSSAFHSHPSWTISSEVRAISVGTRDLPAGHWDGLAFRWDREEGPDHLRKPRPREAYIPPDDPWVNEWCYTGGGSAPSSPGSSPTNPSPLHDIPSAAPTSRQIPIHYPTLCHSRLALSRHIREPSIDHPTHKTTLFKHTDSVYSVIMRGDWMISGSRDRSIRIWRLGPIGPEGGVGPAKCVRAVQDAHTGSVLSLDMDLFGSTGTLVSGSSDCVASIWDIDFSPTDSKRPTITKVADLRGHQGGILDVILTATRVVTASKDASIRIYDRSSPWDSLHVLHHQGPVNGLAIADRTAKQFASVSGDSCWVIWDLESGEEVRRGQTSAVLASVAWKGDWLVMGDSDRMVSLWSAASGERIRDFNGHTDLVRAVSINEKEGILVSGSYDRSIRMWDIHTGELIRKFAPHHSSQIFDLDVTTTRLATASHDNSLQVLTFGTGLPYLALFD